MGLIYLLLVCIRRLRKHNTSEGSGGAVVGAMMGSRYSAEGFDGRPATRTDLQPRERKAKKACHNAAFYKGGFGGPRRRDADSGGMGLSRIGE